MVRRDAAGVLPTVQVLLLQEMWRLDTLITQGPLQKLHIVCIAETAAH